MEVRYSEFRRQHENLIKMVGHGLRKNVAVLHIRSSRQVLIIPYFVSLNRNARVSALITLHIAWFCLGNRIGHIELKFSQEQMKLLASA